MKKQKAKKVSFWADIVGLALILWYGISGTVWMWTIGIVLIVVSTPVFLVLIVGDLMDRVSDAWSAFLLHYTIIGLALLGLAEAFSMPPRSLWSLLAQAVLLLMAFRASPRIFRWNLETYHARTLWAVVLLSALVAVAAYFVPMWLQVSEVHGVRAFMFIVAASVLTFYSIRGTTDTVTVIEARRGHDNAQ